MNYGADQASTFRFTPVQPTTGPSSVIAEGKAAEEQLYGGPGPDLTKLPDDMAQVEGLTSEVMNQWHSAKDYANTMWNTYRIDVTKPDSRNPLSVNANLTYKKYMAAIQNTGAKLKDYNERLKLTDKSVAEGKGTYVQDPRARYFDREAEYFASNTPDPMAQQLNATIGGEVDTPAAAKANNLRYKEERTRLEAERKAALAMGDEGRAQTIANAIGQLGRANAKAPNYHLDPEYLRLQAEKAKAAQGEMEVYNEVALMRQGLVNQDPNAVNRLQAMLIEKNSNRPVKVVKIHDAGLNPGIRIIKRGPGGEVTTEDVFFNTKSQHGGLDRIADLMKSADGTKYNISSGRLSEIFEEQNKGEANTAVAKPTKELQTAVNDTHAVLIGFGYPGDTNIPKSAANTKQYGNLLPGRPIPRAKKLALERALNQVASTGNLFYGDGKEIESVTWNEEDGTITLQVVDLVPDATHPAVLKEVVIDPKNREGKMALKNLMDQNSGELIQNQPATAIGETEQKGAMNRKTLTVTPTSNLATQAEVDALYDKLTK